MQGLTMAMKDAEPAVAKAGAERRRFRRVKIDLPGRLFVPSDSREARCTVTDLSPGGAAIACEVIPDSGTPVVLYVDGFGRFEGTVVRRDGCGFGVSFVCTPSKRERIAEQLILFLNKTLVDDNVLRRHKRSSQKGFAKFTRADGQIVQCEVMDISVSGVTLKSDIKPPIGEFVLIAQIAGRVARHQVDGIGIEFVGQEKSSDQPVPEISIVRA
ncbi:MAG TPA: PilZ domain-containing protein [Rhizomicrobium sp.]|nr:PilZ domain-containing protein [Rhizomicrobium sp.]